MKIYDYTVIFEEVEEGGYAVRIPALPGCFTFGDSLEEARRMAKEAIQCHIEGLLKDGEPVPIEDKSKTHQSDSLSPWRLSINEYERPILTNRFIHPRLKPRVIA